MLFNRVNRETTPDKGGPILGKTSIFLVAPAQVKSAAKEKETVETAYNGQKVSARG